MKTWVITVESDGFDKTYTVRAENEKQAIERVHAKIVAEDWVERAKKKIEER